MFGRELTRSNFQSSLDYLGIKTKEVFNPSPRVQFLGVTLNAKNEVEKISPNSAAFSYLMKGDLILEEEIQDGFVCVFQLVRMGKTSEVSFTFDPTVSFYPQLFLEKAASATAEQTQNFNLWLGEK